MEKIVYDINTLLVKDMKLKEVFAIVHRIEKARSAQKAGIDRDIALAAAYVWNDLLRYHLSDKAFELTTEQFYNLKNHVDDDFVHIHRMNYVVFYVLQEIADDMDDRGQLTFTVKRFWNKVTDVFTGYQKKHRAMIDNDSWMAIQDMTRLSYDEVHGLVEPFETAIRDYLIQKRSIIKESGQKDDISLLTRVYVALHFCAALRNTRSHFFDGISERYGVDFRSTFRYADVDAMCGNFVSMMHATGIRFTKDSDGDDVPLGVDIAKSVRVDAAWNKIVRVVTDRDLMDEKALQAIAMNPVVKADYDALMARSEQKAMAAAIGRLSEHVKVSRL